MLPFIFCVTRLGDQFQAPLTELRRLLKRTDDVAVEFRKVQPTGLQSTTGVKYISCANQRVTAYREQRSMARVPASEFRRQFGRLSDVAREAVIVTSHGRDNVVLLSAAEYQRLRSLDRRAIHVSELTDEELAALDAVDILAETTRYNHEIA